MAVRRAPLTAAPAFASITVCSVAIPADAETASVAGRPIPARIPEQVSSIAMWGDSGCRIATWGVQDCSDPAQWPLARISQRIADDRPDVVLFNGDFYYREASCAAVYQAQCGSSPPPISGLPITDSDYGWIADALLPMAPVLSVAPLIVTRGNHEACNRAGNGYFLLFDPRPGTADVCAPVQTASGLVAAPTNPTGTYAIDLPVAKGRTLRLAIVDSAGGNDAQVDSFAQVQRPFYEAAARMTRPVKGRESWLVTHRPSYGYVSSEYAVPGTPFVPWTSLDQAAASYGLLGNYDLMFSSHIHVAMAVQMPGLPGQLVLGNAGTMLDVPGGWALPTSGPDLGAGLPTQPPSSGWVAVRFGYAMAYPNDDAGSWRLSMRGTSGQQFARCGIRDQRIYCRDTTSR